MAVGSRFAAKRLERKSLYDYWQVLVGVGAVLCTIGAWLYTAGTERAKTDRQIDELHGHIHVLEKIIVSEYPQYTPAIDWDER